MFGRKKKPDEFRRVGFEEEMPMPPAQAQPQQPAQAQQIPQAPLYNREVPTENELLDMIEGNSIRIIELTRILRTRA